MLVALCIGCGELDNAQYVCEQLVRGGIFVFRSQIWTLYMSALQGSLRGVVLELPRASSS